MNKKILSNKAKCKFCGDIIESKHVHDYVVCKCGKISVDGGKYYLKRGFPSGYDYKDCFEDLSTFEEEVDIKDDECKWLYKTNIEKEKVD